MPGWGCTKRAEGRRRLIALAFAVMTAVAIAGCDEQAHDGGPALGGAGEASGAGGAGAAAPAAGASGGAPGASGSNAAAPSGAGSSAPGSADAGITGQAGSNANDAGIDAAAPAIGPAAQDSANALAQLTAYLGTDRSSRPELSTQPFAKVPLTLDDAGAALHQLWDDFAAMVRETRADEVGATESSAKSVHAGSDSLKYYMAVRGAEPAGGRSLFISMHGGGNTTPDVNDEQWRNQISLVEGYDPQDAIWVAPRAPSDDWNMFFTEQIDPLFERLITDMIVFEGINPNKVYLNGYSAGGDAVYQLGPRMAERWAGAAMSAGHPNDASPVNLRNLAFAIHVGGNDTAYDRNLKAQEWGEQLDALADQDPGGYPHQWQVHSGLPHWMNLEDAVSVPFIQGFTRNPTPSKIVWRQVGVTRSRFYWLAVDPANELPGSEIRASYMGNTIMIEDAQNLSKVLIRFSDAMLNLDQVVHIERNGSDLFTGEVARNIEVIARTLEESGDPTMAFYGEVAVELR